MKCGAGYETDVGDYQVAYYLQQSFSGFNITHSYSIDLSNVSKIIVHGSLCSNTESLSATVYAYVSNEELTSISDDWTEMNRTIGSNLSEFTTEIDVNGISGDQYLYFGVKHGEEMASYTVFLYLYDIEFIY